MSKILELKPEEIETDVLGKIVYSVYNQHKY